MIVLRDVGKTYAPFFGKVVEAVRGVSLEVAPGEVLGIAGPNGAGKSTLIAMLLGFLKPTTGTVTIDGLDPRAFVEREGIAYLPELMSLPTHWRVDEALNRLAMLAGIPGSERRAAVDRVIEQLAIGEHRRKRIKALSKGNFQRVGLAQALLREHRVVVFDEPTHGLDPVWTQRFRDMVTSLKRADRTIVIASHNLDELERLADRVVIFDHGVLQRTVSVGGGVTEAGARMSYRIRVAVGADELIARFDGATLDGQGAVLVPPVDLAALNIGVAAAIGAGTLLTSITPSESALEQAFHSAVGGA